MNVGQEQSPDTLGAGRSEAMVFELHGPTMAAPHFSRVTLAAYA